MRDRECTVMTRLQQTVHDREHNEPPSRRSDLQSRTRWCCARLVLFHRASLATVQSHVLLFAAETLQEQVHLTEHKANAAFTPGSFDASSIEEDSVHVATAVELAVQSSLTAAPVESSRSFTASRAAAYFLRDVDRGTWSCRGSEQDTSPPCQHTGLASRSRP